MLPGRTTAWIGAVLLLAGCASTVTGAGRPVETGSALPASPPTTASTGEPTYDGPPEDAPASDGPAATVHTVELTSAYPGADRSFSEFAAAARDGGAYVVMRDDAYTGQRLVTVARSGNGFAVTASVPIPAVAEISGMYPLADGRVLVAGQLASRSQGGTGENPDFGYEIVDPATGDVEPVVVEPHASGTEDSYEQSALSADEQTLYLYVGYDLIETDSRPDPEPFGRLFAVDVASGEVTAQRDVIEDLSTLSTFTSGVFTHGLVARPEGGAALVFDATPDRADEEAVLPTVVSYGAGLVPTGTVQLADADAAVQTRAAVGAPDGTVFVSLAGRGALPGAVPGAAPGLVAVGDGAASGVPLAAYPEGFVSDGLAVEPAQEWAHVYVDEVLQPVDLAAGEVGEGVPVGCDGQGVRDVFPGRDGVVAVLIGECDTPGPRTQYVWLATGS